MKDQKNRRFRRGNHVTEYEPKVFIPQEGKQPGWSEFWVDLGEGWQKLEGVCRAKSINPSLNLAWFYGESLEGGFDGWSRFGGGGGVIWAYTIDPNGKIFISLITRKRRMRRLEESLEAARGMVEWAETPEETAAREGEEELGQRMYMPIRVSGDRPFNADSAFFTSGLSFPKGDIDVFVKEVAFNDLMPNPDGEGFVFTQTAKSESQKVEGITKVVFYPDDRRRINRTGDGITMAAYGWFEEYRDEHIIPNIPSKPVPSPYSHE